MQATDTRSPTAQRPQSVVETSTHDLLKAIGVVFALMMLATTLAFGMTPFAAAVTTLTILVALSVMYALTQPIISWVADRTS